MQSMYAFGPSRRNVAAASQVLLLLLLAIVLLDVASAAPKRPRKTTDKPTDPDEHSDRRVTRSSLRASSGPVAASSCINLVSSDEEEAGASGGGPAASLFLPPAASTAPSEDSAMQRDSAIADIAHASSYEPIAGDGDGSYESFRATADSEQAHFVQPGDIVLFKGEHAIVVALNDACHATLAWVDGSNFSDDWNDYPYRQGINFDNFFQLSWKDIAEYVDNAAQNHWHTPQMHLDRFRGTNNGSAGTHDNFDLLWQDQSYASIHGRDRTVRIQPLDNYEAADLVVYEGRVAVVVDVIDHNSYATYILKHVNKDDRFGLGNEYSCELRHEALLTVSEDDIQRITEAHGQIDTRRFVQQYVDLPRTGAAASGAAASGAAASGAAASANAASGAGAAGQPREDSVRRGKRQRQEDSEQRTRLEKYKKLWKQRMELSSKLERLDCERKRKLEANQAAGAARGQGGSGAGRTAAAPQPQNHAHPSMVTHTNGSTSLPQLESTNYPSPTEWTTEAVRWHFG